MLVTLEYGLIVNTEAIKSIKVAPASANGCERAEVTFTDGTRKYLSQSVDRLEWCTGPVIPAPPGYSVIRAFPPEKGETTWTFATYPVLAFRLTDNEPMPIIPFGRIEDDWALVWPDGRCDQQCNQLFESVDEFKKAFGWCAEGGSGEACT